MISIGHMSFYRYLGSAGAEIDLRLCCSYGRYSLRGEESDSKDYCESSALN